jgi:hypothetical protein
VLPPVAAVEVRHDGVSRRGRSGADGDLGRVDRRLGCTKAKPVVNGCFMQMIMAKYDEKNTIILIIL